MKVISAARSLSLSLSLSLSRARLPVPPPHSYPKTASRSLGRDTNAVATAADDEEDDDVAFVVCCILTFKGRHRDDGASSSVVLCNAFTDCGIRSVREVLFMFFISSSCNFYLPGSRVAVASAHLPAELPRKLLTKPWD